MAELQYPHQLDATLASGEFKLQLKDEGLLHFDH